MSASLLLFQRAGPSLLGNRLRAGTADGLH